MRLFAPLVFLILAACQSEPTFDERYADAEQEIRTKAAELDHALATAEPPPDARD